MNRKILLKFSRIIIIVGLIFLIRILPIGERSYPVSAQAESASARTISKGIGGHTDCLSCHAKPNMIGKFMNGETVSLSFDASQHVGANHGNRGLTCQVCHNEQEEYPHATSPQNTCLVCHQQITDNQSPVQEPALVFEIPMKSRRILSLQLNQTCKRCHKMQDKEVVDSDHTRIMEDGNPNAPVCVDCHGFHNHRCAQSVIWLFTQPIRVACMEQHWMKIQIPTFPRVVTVMAHILLEVPIMLASALTR
jgi:hypothetical protein